MPPAFLEILHGKEVFFAISRLEGDVCHWRRGYLLAFAAFCLTHVSVKAFAQEVPLNQWVVERSGLSVTTSDTTFRFARGSGWIRTHQAFLDFTLHLQFRATSPDAKGAVLIRAYALRPGEWATPGNRIALQADSAKGSIGEVTTRDGSVKDDEAPHPVSPKPLGEWRDLAIRAEGAHIIVSLDGETIRTASVSEP